MKHLIQLLEFLLIVGLLAWSAKLSTKWADAEHQAGYAQGQLDIYTNWSEDQIAKGLKKW